MKIYTKKGDDGTTSLASGKRVTKANAFVDLYGSVDELNSCIGSGISFLGADSSLREPLLQIQSILFELGAELAGFRKEKSEESIIYSEDIEFLEKEIDRLQEQLPPLKKFVLPGGCSAAAFLHLARTVARRLERKIVHAREEGLTVFDSSLAYVNRLSDFLFTAARFANKEFGVEEPLWNSRAKS